MIETVNKKPVGLDIFQPIVPDYRTALFEGLASDPDFEISVQASQSTQSGDQSVVMKVSAYYRNIKTLSFFGGRVIWQSGFRFIKAVERGDVVVVCGDIHQLSSLWMALKAKLKGLGVIWWGHHVSAAPNALFVKIRLAIAKRFSDCVLCYTSQGRDYLLKRGFDPQRVFATGNTLDLDNILNASREWNEEALTIFKNEHALFDTHVLLFCSVLRRKTRLDVLIKALAELRGRDVSLKCVIIGGGEMLKEYQSLAKKLNVCDQIIWAGELRDQKELAPWFLSASAYVYPGPIGLSIIHAFSYGLPVIVNDNAHNHGPEYVVFSEGENGWAFKENDSVDLARVIEQVFSTPEQLKYMGEIGKRIVIQNYSMDRMIERFKEAVLACSRLKNRKNANT